MNTKETIKCSYLQMIFEEIQATFSKRDMATLANALPLGIAVVDASGQLIFLDAEFDLDLTEAGATTVEIVRVSSAGISTCWPRGRNYFARDDGVNA